MSDSEELISEVKRLKGLLKGYQEESLARAKLIAHGQKEACGYALLALLVDCGDTRDPVDLVRQRVRELIGESELTPLARKEAEAWIYGGIRILRGLELACMGTEARAADIALGRDIPGRIEALRRKIDSAEAFASTERQRAHVYEQALASSQAETKVWMDEAERQRERADTFKFALSSQARASTARESEIAEIVVILGLGVDDSLVIKVEALRQQANAASRLADELAEVEHVVGASSMAMYDGTLAEKVADICERLKASSMSAGRPVVR